MSFESPGVVTRENQRQVYVYNLCGLMELYESCCIFSHRGAALPFPSSGYLFPGLFPSRRWSSPACWLSKLPPVRKNSLLSAGLLFFLMRTVSSHNPGAPWVADPELVCGVFVRDLDVGHFLCRFVVFPRRQLRVKQIGKCPLFIHLFLAKKSEELKHKERKNAVVGFNFYFLEYFLLFL